MKSFESVIILARVRVIKENVKHMGGIAGCSNGKFRETMAKNVERKQKGANLRVENFSLDYGT